MESNTSSVAADIASGDQVSVADISRQFEVNPSPQACDGSCGPPRRSWWTRALQQFAEANAGLVRGAALERFLSALPQSVTTSVRTPTKRERDSARARETLKNKYAI